jgi:hypothetical protein
MAKKNKLDLSQSVRAIAKKTTGQQLKPAGKKPLYQQSHALRSKTTPR